MPNQPEYTQHERDEMADKRMPVCDICNQPIDAEMCRQLAEPKLEAANARIAELEAEAHTSMQQHDSLCHELMDAEEEIKRLRGIVEQLPKTADGVPAVPGTRLFPMYPVLDDEHPDYDDAARLEYCISDPLSGEFIREHDGLEIDACYSTKEAAEAARGKP